MNKNNKKGFTLIELLAVIIILGVIMLIAIPSVTRYINDSRKETYLDTARQIVKGAIPMVNGGELDVYDTNTTYYIPASCIPTENSMSSPFGEFEQAYVIVGYTGEGYVYYWASTDKAHQGIEMKEYNKLTKSDVKSNVESIDTTLGIGSRTDIKILDKESCQTFELSEGNSTNGGTITPNIVCKPATDLHTKTCEATVGCSATVGNGNLITYGTIVSGNPKAGDAYDCKVTSDGDFTERFYYVKSGTEVIDGESKNVTILLYYKNMNGQTTYAYDSSNQNYHGPRTAYQYLPSKLEWNNPRLLNSGTRHIVTQNDSTSTVGGAIEPFVYEGKAARFLTYQEVFSVCGSVELKNCPWLMENIGWFEESSGCYGYWLETPNYNDAGAWHVHGYNHRLNSSTGVYYSTSLCVRPAITVLTSDISR